MIQYLKEENIDENLIRQLEAYRKENGLPNNDRVIKPEYKYYGKEVLEEAIAALLAGKNILLTGAKATGKNVLSSNLSYLFQRILSKMVKLFLGRVLLQKQPKREALLFWMR